MGRIGFGLQRQAKIIKRIAKYVFEPVHGAKEIGNHGKTAAFDTSKKQRGASCRTDATMDFGRFKVRIDWLLDPNQHASGVQVVDALA